MPRKTFDKIVSSVGALLTVALVVAAGLMFWGYSFANDSVHDQLAAQKIFFPEAGSESLKPPEIGRYLNKYAGQQLVTGEQAKAYADHFVGVHLKESSGGKTYAELGGVQAALRAQIATAEATKDPKLASLEAQLKDVTATRETVFKGEAIRGVLLSAYAFWKIGQLALIGSIASIAIAAGMLVLTMLGFRHAGRVSAEEQIFAPVAAVRKLA